MKWNIYIYNKEDFPSPNNTQDGIHCRRWGSFHYIFILRLSVLISFYFNIFNSLNSRTQIIWILSAPWNNQHHSISSMFGFYIFFILIFHCFSFFFFHFRSCFVNYLCLPSMPKQHKELENNSFLFLMFSPKLWTHSSTEFSLPN